MHRPVPEKYVAKATTGRAESRREVILLLDCGREIAYGRKE